ncbi:MAG: type II toxin-antitoxin system Phd/YefM family antitoxin [Patescibacteria group bacterium]
MTTTIPLTKARVNLGALVKRVHLKKERFVLEKDGYPVAVLMDIDEYEDYLDSQDEALKKQIRQSHKEFEAGKGRPLDDLIAKMRRKYGV